MTWGEQFKEARGELSQSEAAKHLFGCSVRTIQVWECDHREPPDWVKGLILAHMKHGKKAPTEAKTVAKKRRSDKPEKGRGKQASGKRGQLLKEFEAKRPNRDEKSG